MFYGKYMQNYQPSVKGILSLVKDIVAMTNTISGQTSQIQQPVQSIPQMQIKPQTLNNNLKNNPVPIHIPFPQTSNQQASFSQSSSSSTLSYSLLPQILTPTLNQPSTTLNLRTNPTDSGINTPTINLSQSLLNKSWLPF